MACFSPLKGYRSPSGKVVFNHRAGWVDRHVTVSCGQCSGCRLERSRQWAVRCMHEAQLHDRNSFITLTYDNANLPSNRSLDLHHWQTFAKRTRKALGPFRFYHCGEYGDLGGRPHYHACLFGMDFPDRKPHSEKRGNLHYTSATLSELWGKGFCIVGEVTFQSAAYVARYIMKKQTGKTKTQKQDLVDQVTGEVFSEDVKPEYTTMSRRPGLGANWLARYHKDVYPDDFVISNGKKARPPKFYDSQYELLSPQSALEIKRKRVKAALKHHRNNTPERLAVRETIQLLKVKQLTREL